MFTGIVEETGSVKSINGNGDSYKITISCKKVLEDSKIGDSIAVNGVCLTVTDMTDSQFCADVMPETIHRSSLSSLKEGSTVNLERAMAAGGRFGGHIVSGHIDGTGTVAEIKKDSNAVWYTINCSKQLLRYIVEKGSVTLDGISLTVAYVDDSSFKVSVIPHTREVTNLTTKNVGSIINIENDIIGKYVEKLMLPASENETPKSRITADFLAENGFM